MVSSSYGVIETFEDVRISIITVVAWFYEGERGFFRYWPAGRDNDSVRHERMWNTAVAGDNDFMHHLVERVGPKGSTPPEGMTINTELSFSDTNGTLLRMEKSYRHLMIRVFGCRCRGKQSVFGYKEF